MIQLMSSMARESQLRSQLLEARLVAKEDQVNFGGIPKAVEKALRDGSYTAISHFWDRAVAEKRASILGSVVKPVTKAKDYDWNDWIQAMLKMATAYMAAGQKDIGRQVVNLLHGAMITSASYYRQSVMEACEAVRRTSTSSECNWSAQSFMCC